MGAELFHVDGRTDMSKLIVAIHNSANAPKMVFISQQTTNEKNLLRQQTLREREKGTDRQITE